MMQLFGAVLLAFSVLLTGCPTPESAQPTLSEVRSTLQSSFTAADTNADALLSLSEAQAVVSGMSSSQFNELDTDQDGALSGSEVGLSDGAEGEGEGESTTPVRYTYSVIDTFPHDTTAFTQGLVIDGDQLFEGTGLWGHSSLRRVDLTTGAVQQQTDLTASFFGEGIVVWQNTIIQLTWRSHRAFLYDKTTFEATGEFAYASEGWGITHNCAELIMSDGTSRLRFLNPDSYEVTREVTVLDEGVPVSQLNELEYIQGEVWANVWQTDLIARIDPADGRVVGWVDLTGLLTPTQRSRADVLNGIAYDKINDRILVTGKYWPSIFQIEVSPVP